MKFRPSYYAQQQLTSYAPSANYPGFYGQAEGAVEEEKDAETLVTQLYKWCDQKYETSPGKRLACRGAVWTASKLGATALQRVSEEWFGKKVTTADTGSSGGSRQFTLPSNLSASEKARIDACKKKPFLQQAACLAKTVSEINAERASGKGAGGSNTVWWVLGTLAAAGAVGGIWYATSKRRSS